MGITSAVNFICGTCGTEYADSIQPPPSCPICEDERQYVGLEGQRWTTLEELRKAHGNRIQLEEAKLTSIVTEPKFGIGQRAFIVETPEGNLLWDCVSLIDDATIEHIRQTGGLNAIAISHPHYYTTMVEWSRACGKIPIFLHEADRRWAMRRDDSVVFWGGAVKAIFGGLTLIRGGGHFEGGTILHWPAAAEGQGALLPGDIIQVVPDRRWVSFMYSYPNYIPLSAAAVEHILDAVEPFEFDRIYGAFPGMTVTVDGKAAVRRSVERYIAFLSGSRSDRAPGDSAPGHSSR